MVLTLMNIASVMCLYGIRNFEQISHLIISRSDNGEVRVSSDFVSAVSKLTAAHQSPDGSEPECVDVVLRSLQGSDVANSRGLGDIVAAGLAAVGITKERVSAAIGRPCGCGERQAVLNSLGAAFLGLPEGSTAGSRDAPDPAP